MAGRIAIVCAMTQEVQPLVREWRKVRERGLTFFESDKAVVVVAGIGSAPAAMASMTLIAREQPCCLMSVGLAGALRDDLRVGDILSPGMVVNVATNRRFVTGCMQQQGSGGESRTEQIQDRCGRQCPPF